MDPIEQEIIGKTNRLQSDYYLHAWSQRRNEYRKVHLCSADCFRKNRSQEESFACKDECSVPTQKMTKEIEAIGTSTYKALQTCVELCKANNRLHGEVYKTCLDQCEINVVAGFDQAREQTEKLLAEFNKKFPIHKG